MLEDSGTIGIEVVIGPATRTLPSDCTEMIGMPTPTVSPSLARSCSTVPENGQGSSTIDFAVSISQITWFTVTVSPGATFQETISASVRPSPTSGKLNIASDIVALL